MTLNSMMSFLWKYTEQNQVIARTNTMAYWLHYLSYIHTDKINLTSEAKVIPAQVIYV